MFKKALCAAAFAGKKRGISSSLVAQCTYELKEKVCTLTFCNCWTFYFNTRKKSVQAVFSFIKLYTGENFTISLLSIEWNGCWQKSVSACHT